MINAAIIDENNIVTNVIVLNSLEELFGAVECPEWVGIGMDINTPKPTDLAQEEVNTLNREYLESTDWYVVRFVETGVPIPQEVFNKRAEARLQII